MTAAATVARCGDPSEIAGMPYQGGKAGPGVYQRLINEIPPHDVYVAGFAGHDAIAQYKLPAKVNILFDLDPEPLEWWSRYQAEYSDDQASVSRETRDQATSDRPKWIFKNEDSIAWIRSLAWMLRDELLSGSLRRWFIYLDPPYLMSTRSSGPMYRHELSPEGHVSMLKAAKLLPCNVMISGYWSELYAEHLADWRAFNYQSMTRGGSQRTEWAWCNYDSPAALHDSRFVGNDKREREKIRRRTKRLVANLLNLSPHERQSVLDGVAGRVTAAASRQSSDRTVTPAETADEA